VRIACRGPFANLWSIGRGGAVDVWNSLRNLLRAEMTVAEWLGAAVLLNIPYVVVGVAWSVFNADRLAGLEGPRLVGSLVVGVVCWPVLLAHRRVRELAAERWCDIRTGA